MRARPNRHHPTKGWLVALTALIGSLDCAWAQSAAAPSGREAPTCDRGAFRLVLDVGHSDQVPGAKTARGFREYDYNLRLAKLIDQQLIAAGFAVALLSWPVAVLLAVGFLAIYVPVIASEERFLRATFPEFEAYCRRVPRFFPRFTPGAGPSDDPAGHFAWSLYLKHREYNALLGVLLLYMSLAFLRPAITFILHGRP